MKNILFTIVTVLLIILTVIMIVKGIKIGSIQLMSLSQIKEKSEELKTQSANANDLNLVQYNQNLEQLQKAQKTLVSAKNKYLDVASISSDEEIREANQTQTYAMEYLWSRIGNHATERGVNIKLDVTPTGTANKNTLDFAVEGAYSAILDFIYDLENEEGFRIYNFKMIPTGDKKATLNSTFTVMDVAIKEEKTSAKVEDTSKTSDSAASK